MKDARALYTQINKLFFEKLNLEAPAVDTDLVEEGILDSLAFVELLVSLEQEFETKIPLDTIDIENFRSIAKIAEFLVGADQLRKIA
ncbi:MAG: acyl carrier protein [Acidobacteria bacterium]|nr:acyl carrier protein [Acidobacteriota bacterium]